MKIHLGKLRISSPSFSHGERIPDRHAVGDRPTSPPPGWSDPPGGTQSYAFVVHDPDAPLTYCFTHWVLYGIPASTTGIAEGDGDGFVQGLNGRGGREYVPPAPRPGHGDHFYYFKLYALDRNLALPPGPQQS